MHDQVPDSVLVKESFEKKLEITKQCFKIPVTTHYIKTCADLTKIKG